MTGIRSPRPSTPTLKSNRQTVKGATPAERTAMLDKFQARNGKQWDFLTHDASYDSDDFGKTVRYLRRTDVAGPSTHPTRTQAKAAADAVVKKNADLLGLSPEVLAKLSVSVEAMNKKDAITAWKNTDFIVSYKGTITQPGFEKFPEVATKVDLEIGVEQDGQVRFIGKQGEDATPLLSLGTKPNLKATDPRIRGSVLGQQLVSYAQDLKTPNHTYQTFYVGTKLGKITDKDIASVRPAIVMKVRGDAASRSETFILAYDFTVKKDGHTFHFKVDAGTGELLEKPELPVGGKVTRWA